MGLDVELHAVGTVTDDQLATANTFMLQRGVHGWDRDDPPLSRTEWGVKWDTLDRYYNKGYERGWWPKIHNAIVCLRAALPECEIRYGGDADPCAPPGTLITSEKLSDLWSHWLGSDGLAYRER